MKRIFQVGLGVLIVLASLANLVYASNNLGTEKTTDFYVHQGDNLLENNIRKNWKQLDGYFTENRGQLNHDDIRYYLRGNGISVGFADSMVLFNLRQRLGNDEESQDRISSSGELIQSERSMLHDVNSTAAKERGVMIQMRFEGANYIAPVGRGEHSFKSNYFIGNDLSKWKIEVSNFRKIVFAGLYDNINLIYSVVNERLKYEFIVNSYSDPNLIRLTYEGVKALSLDDEGNLIISTVVGDLMDEAPYIYQTKNGKQHPVAGHYVLFDLNTVGFEVEDYDITLPLIIDPELRYSTFVGGSGVAGSALEYGRTIVVDANGDVHVTGHTKSADFPTTAGGYDTSFNGGHDVFVFKLNSDGSMLLYSTFVGGGSIDWGYGIAVDDSGNAYVAGSTSSSNFPTTAGAYDTSFNGMVDVFVFKLNPDGSTLLYSTFVGSGSSEDGRVIAVDTTGNAYVTGETSSPAFPTTAGAYDNSYNGAWDGFVFKLTSNGSTLLYSTFVGGSSGDAGLSIAIDSSNNTYIAGQTSSSGFPTTASAYDTSFNGGSDGFVLKLNSAGSTLLFSTFVGGTSSEYRFEVAVDASGNMYVSGDTFSSDFPTTVSAYDASHNGGLDVFVFKLNYTGSTLIYSTFLGGVNDELGRGIAIDLSGNAYVTGDTDSSDFPTTANAYDTSNNGGRDVFVLKLNSAGSMLLYSTFVGGTSTEYGTSIALDSSLNAYVTGETMSSNFPTTAGAYDTSYNGGYDIIAFKLNMTFAPTLMVTGADMAPAVVVRGQLNVSMVRMAFAAVNGNFTLTGLRVNLTGIGDDADISTVKLYDDVNDNNTLDGADVQLASGSFTGKTILFPLSFPIANSTTERMLIIYDISSAATSGETVGALVEYNSVTATGGVVEPFGPIQSTNLLINTPPSASNLGVNGVYIQPIRVSTPVSDLNWTHTDADGHSQAQYAVRVGTTSSGSDMWDSGPQIDSANTVAYGGAPLSICTSYYFGVHVNDSYEWGDWTEVPFRVNGPPSAPQTPTNPTDGALVPYVDGPLQTVSWTAAFDCDSDTLQYAYEIRENATVIVAGTTNGLTSIGFDTNASSTYHVNVTASDGIATSPALYWHFNTTASVPPDTEPPTVAVTDSPDPQFTAGTVWLNATVTDNVVVQEVWLNITDPIGMLVGNFSMLYNPGTGNWEYNKTFIDIGMYNYTVWALDTSDNWGSAKGTFNITAIVPPDTAPPTIASATAEPDPQFVGLPVTIEATVSDNVGVDLVAVDVRYPNGTAIGNFTMTYNATNEKWEISKTFTIVGLYSFTIWARDTNGNWATASGSFTIEPKTPTALREYNWKPIIALIFIITLLIIGLLVSYKRPIRFSGILRKDRLCTFLGGVLPFVIAEGVTGQISLFTGLLSVPPILGSGMLADLSILIVGIIVCAMIFNKGSSAVTYGGTAQPMPSKLPPSPPPQSLPPSTKLCPNCGQALELEYMFCPYCGATM